MSKAKIVAFLAALTVFPAASGAQDPGSLFVKVDKLTPELVSAVAKIGVERIVSAKPGTDILKLISDVCGSANARRSYLEIFLRTNTDIADIKAGRTITTENANLKLPACLFSEEQVVAVPVDRSGPRWDKPIAASLSAIEALNNPVISDWTPDGDAWLTAEKTARPKWKPSDPANIFATWGPQVTVKSAKKNGSIKPKENVTADVSVKQLPGQSLDLKRIAYPTGRELPEELSNRGISLTRTIDSTRLADPELKVIYDRLVAQVVAQLEKGGKISDRDGFIRTAPLEGAFRTQDVLASNESADFTKLPTGSTVLSSDFAPGILHVKVKPELLLKTAALDLANAIKASNPNTAIDPASDPAPYFASPQTTETAEACKPKAGEKWPFDASELKKVLRLRALADRKPTLGRILILDTGFPPDAIGTSPFEKHLFVRKASEPADDTGQSYLWSHTTENGKPVYFVPGLTYSTHGVEVLTLALGGIDAWNDKLLGSNIALGGGHIMSLMGYSGSSGKLVLNGDAIASSLSGSRGGRQVVNVVNLSLKFKMEADRRSTLRDSIRRRRHVLFVFAAGNGTSPLLDEYPAIWGGPNGDNIITVGASRPDGKYADDISHFSKDYVDIAAPGCGVPTLTWNQSTDKFEQVLLDGTSLAAPLVSFAANLIHGDYGGNAEGLKSRLISSGRYSEHLDKKVWSERILDIPVAVAFPFDAVRMKDNTLRLGRVGWPEAGNIFCHRQHPRGKIRQVHSVGDNATRISALFYDDSLDKVMVWPVCPLNDNELAQISFREAVEGANSLTLAPAAETLDMRQLKSITFCDDCYAWQ